MTDKHTLKREQYIITGSRDFQDNIEIIDFCKTLDEAKTDLKYLKVLTNVSGYVEELFECHKNIHFIENVRNQTYRKNDNLIKTECVYKSTMINNMEMMIIRQEEDISVAIAIALAT